MAKVNVTIHGEEDVSTASQKVRESLHDLKDKAKETISPFKDLTDTIKTVAGLGGAAMVLKQIYGELSQMEAAFVKANPAAQAAAGSLTQWNDAMARMKVDAGGVVAGVLNPIRDALLDIIDPSYAVKNALEGINKDLATLTGQYLSAETKKVQDLAKAEQDLADAIKQSAAAAAERSEYARMLEAMQTTGRPDTSAEGIAAYAAEYGISAGDAMTILESAAAEWDRQVRDLQIFISDLDVTIERTGLLIQEIPKRIEDLTKPAGKPAAAPPAAPWSYSGPATYPGPINPMTYGFPQYNPPDLNPWSPLGINLIPEGYEDPVVYAQLMAEKFAQALVDKGSMGQFGDIRRIDAVMGEYTPPPPPEPTLLERTGKGLADIWSGGATGRMFGEGGDPLGALADSISPLLASFGSLQMLLDPIGVILEATFDALEPLIDSLLTPLIGILTIIGQTLAATIAPLLKFLAPVIEWIGQAFVWLYNNAIVPVGNVLITIYTAFTALATLLFYIVTFQWGKISGIHWAPAAGDLLQPITTGQLTEAGVATTGTGGYGGSSTNVVKPPDIYVYLTVEGSVYGAGGPVEVGREMVHAIEEYIGTGARVTFLEAGA